jgi:hypothetical protein
MGSAGCGASASPESECEPPRKHCISAKAKSDLDRGALPVINSREIDCLDHKRLIQQFVGLTRGQGNPSIHHGPNQEDDISGDAGTRCWRTPCGAHRRLEGLEREPDMLKLLALTQIKLDPIATPATEGLDLEQQEQHRHLADLTAIFGISCRQRTACEMSSMQAPLLRMRRRPRHRESRRGFARSDQDPIGRKSAPDAAFRPPIRRSEPRPSRKASISSARQH